MLLVIDSVMKIVPMLARVVIGAALLFTCQGRAAGNDSALRLSGSFIQLTGEMQTWTPEQWAAVLGKMKELRMNTIIIQMLATDTSGGGTYSYISPPGQRDATETILNYADTNGFKVFLGTYASSWNHDMLGSNYFAETRVKMASVAQQAWSRYLLGNRHPSFTGWYIPYEPWTGDYQPAEIERLRGFLQGIAADAQLISGEVPLAISPFISAQRPSPCRVEQNYKSILTQSGIDILLLQDSVGAQKWNTEIVARVAPYAEAFKNACAVAGVSLWANLESFQIIDTTFTSCEAERMRYQFEATAPYVQNFVTFDFVHYMNPVVFLSSWDQARRERMQRLYTGYKAAFVDTDYNPFAPPLLSARLAGPDLVLTWQGAMDDQHQVLSKTNLADDWALLPVPVATNAPGSYRLQTPIAPKDARFYKVQRLPRLQVANSLVWIPPGGFLMGTPAWDTNRTPAELDQFPASITRGFWIGSHEVTQWEYQSIMCANPSAYPSDLTFAVERVTWSEAMEYCARLTAREREAGRLPAGYAYRLPTETEWEYAARAGSTNAYSFGDDVAQLGNYAWYIGSSGARPHPVAQLAPNDWGLRDAHGSVYEWCRDWIESTPAGTVVDFIGTTNGPNYAVRGGAWSFPAVNCRSSWRAGYPPIARLSYLGFRVVLAPVP